MEAFFKWMASNAWAGYLGAALLVTLVVTVVVACFGALRQGRELQLWPPKLGPRTASPAASTTGTINAGLIEYNRDSHALDNKASRIRTAKKEVWMIGASMHYTLHNQKELIIERVMTGLDFHLLVADPDGIDYEATARCFGQDRAALLKETDMTLGACREIAKRLQEAKGTFQVRLMDRVFTSGVYFFDPQNDDATMFLVPHIPGHDAPISPGFEFRKVKGGLLDDYFVIYRGIWNKSARPFRDADVVTVPSAETQQQVPADVLTSGPSAFRHGRR